MSPRTEFIHLAELNGANISQLCQRFGISRNTGYKWLKRRPQLSPRRSPAETEAMVVQVRQTHPAWGGRNIKAYLERKQDRLIQTAAPALPRPGQ